MKEKPRPTCMGESRSRAHKFPRSLFEGKNKNKNSQSTRPYEKSFERREFFFFAWIITSMEEEERLCAALERTGSRDFLLVSRPPEKKIKTFRKHALRKRTQWEN